MTQPDPQSLDAGVLLEHVTESVTSTDLERPGPRILYVNAAFEVSDPTALCASTHREVSVQDLLKSPGVYWELGRSGQQLYDF